MARNNRNTNIGVGLDTSGIAEGVAQITGALRGLTAEIGKIGATAQGSVEPVAKAFKQVHDTSGLAGAGVMAMSGIISDANYGIRGIANNLQQFSGLMVTLVSQTGSVTAAFRSLWSALMGPLGIMLAFTTGIALLERFGMQSDKTKKETDKLAESFNNEEAKAARLFGTLTSLVETNAGLGEIKKAAKQINDEYNLSLNAEKINLDDINKAYQNVIASLKAKIAIESGEEAFKKGRAAEINSSIQLIKLEAERTKLVEKRKLLNQAIVGQAEKFDEYTADILDLDKKIAEQQAIKQEGLNQQNIATFAQIDAQKKLNKLQGEGADNTKLITKNKVDSVQISASDLAMQQIDRDNKAYEQIKENTLQNQQEINEMHDFQADLMEQYWNEPIEYTGEKFEKVKQGLKRDFEQLTQQIQQSVERFIEATIVNLFDALGASVINGSDSLKKFGQEFMGELGVFFQQIGAMLISYGVAMKAFQSSFENPIGLIVAGAALVAIGGAIKAAHKKKFGESAGSSAAMPYTPTATGYANQDGTITLYTRVDGRDLILSADRVGYTQRR